MLITPEIYFMTKNNPIAPSLRKLQGFHFILIFGWVAWHVGFYFPNQGSNLCLLQWGTKPFTTGPQRIPYRGLEALC